MVSWLRSPGLAVLAVGGLVFSSDPRLGVLAVPGGSQLEISDVAARDRGVYLCQANTVPPARQTVTLTIRPRPSMVADTPSGPGDSAGSGEGERAEQTKQKPSDPRSPEPIPDSDPGPSPEPRGGPNLLLLCLSLFSVLVAGLFLTGCVIGWRGRGVGGFIQQRWVG